MENASSPVGSYACTTLQQEMEAYDSLPLEIRQALCYSDNKWAAFQILVLVEHRRQSPEAIIASIARKDQKKREANAIEVQTAHGYGKDAAAGE